MSGLIYTGDESSTYCHECGEKRNQYETHSCIKTLTARIQNLQRSKIDKEDSISGFQYPNMGELIRMQENAMQLMEIAVQTSQAKHDHLHQGNFKEDVMGMIAEARENLNSKVTDQHSFSVWKKVKALEADLAQTNWANKMVAGFVVDDFKGSLPQSFMERFKLRRVELTLENHNGTGFEYPAVRDLLFYPSNIFELREFHGIEWQIQTNGSIRMPRFTFLGEDSDDFIRSPINLKDHHQGKLKQFGMRAIIPDDGVKSVIVRSTPQWVRQIIFVSNQNQRICDIQTGVDEGTIQRFDLEDDEEIVGMFGTVDERHDLKSFGIIVFTPETD